MLKAAEISGFPAVDTPYKKTDERGLYLLIKPNGSKLWYFKYRFGGKEKKMPIGQFPEIGLARARQIRDVARVKIAEGLDPMLQRKREKMTAKINSANSFELVALEYIEEKMVRQNLAEATLRKARWFLDLLRPAIGAMPIAEVDPQMMLAPLKRLEARGNLESAKKCRSFASRVFRYGLRSTASTMLNESGKWHPDAIERALAHGDSNAVRGAYNRGHYWDERVRMAQWWSDYLDQLREGGKVIPMKRGEKAG